MSEFTSGIRSFGFEGIGVDRQEQRELREGAGEALSASFEMIATPALFGFFGWLLDRALDTIPIFTLTFAGVVLAYEVWRFYTAYAAKMDEELQERRSTYGGSAADG